MNDANLGGEENLGGIITIYIILKLNKLSRRVSGSSCAAYPVQQVLMQWEYRRELHIEKKQTLLIEH